MTIISPLGICISISITVFGGLLAAAIYASIPTVALRIARLCSRLLSADTKDKYDELWRAEINAIRNRLAKFVYAIALPLAVVGIRVDTSVSASRLPPLAAVWNVLCVILDFVLITTPIVTASISLAATIVAACRCGPQVWLPVLLLSVCAYALLNTLVLVIQALLPAGREAYPLAPIGRQTPRCLLDREV